MALVQGGGSDKEEPVDLGEMEAPEEKPRNKEVEETDLPETLSEQWPEEEGGPETIDEGPTERGFLKGPTTTEAGGEVQRTTAETGPTKRGGYGVVKETPGTTEVVGPEAEKERQNGREPSPSPTDTAIGREVRRRARGTGKVEKREITQRQYNPKDIFKRWGGPEPFTGKGGKPISRVFAGGRGANIRQAKSGPGAEKPVPLGKRILNFFANLTGVKAQGMTEEQKKKLQKTSISPDQKHKAISKGLKVRFEHKNEWMIQPLTVRQGLDKLGFGDKEAEIIAKKIMNPDYETPELMENLESLGIPLTEVMLGSKKELAREIGREGQNAWENMKRTVTKDATGIINRLKSYGYEDEQAKRLYRDAVKQLTTKTAARKFTLTPSTLQGNVNRGKGFNQGQMDSWLAIQGRGKKVRNKILEAGKAMDQGNYSHANNLLRQVTRALPEGQAITLIKTYAKAEG